MTEERVSIVLDRILKVDYRLHLDPDKPGGRIPPPPKST